MSAPELLRPQYNPQAEPFEAVKAVLPHLALRSTLYLPDRTFQAVESDLSSIEQHAMDMCQDLGNEALQDGNPPIGAVIINHQTGQLFGAKTIDKTMPRLLAHAEVRAYNMAQHEVGDDLSDCTLVSSAQPCSTCTPPYAEGKIGKIVYAAPRWAVHAVAGIMRPRAINMHELLTDGNTKTTVTEGFQAAEVLGAFAMWAELHAEGKVNA